MLPFGLVPKRCHRHGPLARVLQKKPSAASARVSVSSYVRVCVRERERKYSCKRSMFVLNLLVCIFSERQRDKE